MHRRSNRIRMNVWAFLRNRYVFLAVKLLLIVAALGGLAYGGKYILTSEKFKLKNVEIISSGDKSQAVAEEKTNKLKGSNIFTIRPKSIDKELKEASVYIKSVVTEKKLPDTLVIRIQEREPSFVMATLTGAYLLDEEGVVLSVKPGFNELELTDHEMEMLRGYASIGIESSSSSAASTDNQTSVTTDNTVAAKTEEEIASENAERIKAKKQEVEENKMLIASRVRAFWSNTIDVNDSFFKDHKIVYNYDRKYYVASNVVDSNIFNFSKQILAYKWDYLKPNRVLWESNIKLVINTQEGTELVFSLNRKLEDQIYDLNAVLNDAKFYNIKYSRIDLSTDKILVVES